MSKGYKLIFTPAQLEEIERLYNDEGLIIKEIADRFGVSYTGIWAAMVKAGIKRRQAARKYIVNQHVFDKIDNELAAYWLGFIYADGCVRKTFLQVILSIKDVQVLANLRDFMQSNCPISIRTAKSGYGAGKQVARVAFFGEHLSERLRELGILTGRPNHKLAIDAIPESLLHHWIRGFFDGDGSADGNKSIWFCGPQKLMEFLRSLFAKRADRNPNLKIIKHCKSELYYLRYKGFYNAHTIAGIMYKDATVWLTRKRQIIQSWPKPMSRQERGKLRWKNKPSQPSN